MTVREPIRVSRRSPTANRGPEVPVSEPEAPVFPDGVAQGVEFIPPGEAVPHQQPTSIIASQGTCSEAMPEADRELQAFS